MKKIIAFAGRKRSGKGLLSDVIKREDNNVVILTIADYLKCLCCDLLSIDYDTLIQKKDDGSIFNILPSKRWYKVINKRTNIPIEIIKNEIENVTFTNIRQMLQIIGTDLIRKYYPDWHIDNLVKDINSYSDDKIIVVDDVRFKNEKDKIESLGGEVFFIIRPNYFDVSNHISEISLKWQNFDNNHVIINDMQKNIIEEYFRISYKMNFKENKNIPIFLSANEIYQHVNNCSFPHNNINTDLLNDILEQNKNKPLFLNNGIIHYTASTRNLAKKFIEELMCLQQNSYNKEFILYNPLINENLKKYM